MIKYGYQSKHNLGVFCEKSLGGAQNPKVVSDNGDSDYVTPASTFFAAGHVLDAESPNLLFGSKNCWRLFHNSRISVECNFYQSLTDVLCLGQG